ncbi:hypothetical protein IEO21_00236 [Rhodonia placenta]|uniref:Spc7 kinetochore protein domain-containing protein n=1 Tax=Rhodonia placenta TaxID=104341 RepID=A0A8H7PBK5_9APHY|nr:hypothetical protein IEO21_00236 [Postia placenta]
MESASVFSGAGDDERVVKVPLGVSVGPPAAEAPVQHPITTQKTPSPPIVDSTTSAPAPRPPIFSTQTSSRPSIFSAPAAKTPAQTPRSPSKIPTATVPKPFTFSLARSTAQVAPSPVPSGASAGSNVPQSPAVKPSAAFAPPSVRKSPQKRPAPPESESAAQPSPAKRAAIGKLEPAKKAPFERIVPSGQLPVNRRASMVRRPSGYFAQRKSLGAGVLPSAAGSNGRLGSPKKPGAVGLRPRSSVGAAPSGQGLGIAPLQERTAEEAQLYPDVARILREDPPTPSRTGSPASGNGKSCERETLRQAIAIPSPTRGSPSPASSRPSSPSPFAARLSAPQRIPSPAVPLLEPETPGASSAQSPPPAVVPALTVTQTPFLSTGIPRPTAQVQSENSATQQWQQNVVQEDLGYEDEGPPISIEQFFEMTGIRFMDELTMPKPRQSIAPPPQLRARSRRRSSAEFISDAYEDDPISLAEFSVTMAVELPQLELFAAVSNDLTAWIEESKKICLEAENETEKVTPELFRDFVAADESEKSLLVHQLKLIKANNYGSAKSQWYDWKTVWIERLDRRAEEEFSHLESDAQVLAKVVKQAQGILPDLRAEYAQVMAELEQEQADIAEIETSDQDYLGELKATIAEQTCVTFTTHIFVRITDRNDIPSSNELEAFRIDVSESRAKLERFEEKLAEIESQKQEASNAIAYSQHSIHIKKEGTSVEVIKLRDELEALQDLHLWRTTKLSADVVEFIYASRYQVTIPCIMHKPIANKVSISRARDSRTRERDTFPRFTDLALLTAQQMVASLGQCSLRGIVDRLSDFWSSCSQVRSQFTFLAVKYPLSVETRSKIEGQLPDLHAKATVMFPSVKGKAYISFIFDSQTYSRWPMSFESLKADVEVAYGRIRIINILRNLFQDLFTWVDLSDRREGASSGQSETNSPDAHDVVPLRLRPSSAMNTPPSSLRDIYVTPSNAWSFIPPPPGPAPENLTSVYPSSSSSSPSYQWSTRTSQNPFLDLSVNVADDESGVDVTVLAKGLAGAALLRYVTTAIVMPWQVGRILLQVQWVPRDAGEVPPDAVLTTDAVEEDELSDTSNDNDAYFADPTKLVDDTASGSPPRLADERGYIVRQSVLEEGTIPEYVMPVGTSDGPWGMMKQLGRFRAEGWLSLWKGSSSLLLPVASYTLTGFLLSPLDLIRTRLIIQSSHPRYRTYSGPIDALQQILTQEGGLRGIYLHPHLLIPALLDCALHALLPLTLPGLIASYLGFGAQIAPETHPMFWAVAELLGGCAGFLITLPVETVRRRLQAQMRGTARPLRACVELRPAPYNGVVDTMWHIVTEERSDLPLRTKSRQRHGKAKEDTGREEVEDASWSRSTGVGQLYRGLSIRIMASVVMFVAAVVSGDDTTDAGWAEL